MVEAGEPLWWLIDKGVDPKGVTFVEVSFPTMNDILKSGAVDAVLTGEPFATRMANAGTGTVAFRYVSELSRTEPIIFYAASRDWAEKNPEVIRKFREGIAEGAKIGMELEYVSGADVQALVERLYRSPADVIKRAQAIFSGN